MGGLYNMVRGFNPACVLVMPMLGRKENEWPRFRDCFVSKDGKRIVILTRVGGNNRDQGYGEEELYKDPLFVTTYDAEDDNTYGFYEFNVPEKWKRDFEFIVAKKPEKVSDEYVKYLKEFYPKLAESGMIDKVFCRGEK